MPIPSRLQKIRANAGDRPTHLIYVGDYDPAGVLIDKKIEEEPRGRLPGYEITFHRITINREQMDLKGLPTKQPKKGDKRGGWSSGQGTVEAEAMPAGVVRRLLCEAIEQLIDPHQLAVLEEAEESERRTLVGEAMRLRSITCP